MPLVQSLLKNVKLNLTVLNTYGTYPYQIDTKSGKLTFSNERNLERENLKNLSLLFFTLLMIYQNFQYKNGFKSPVLYEVALYITCQLVFICIVRIYFKRHKDVVHLFNTLIHFEQGFCKGII